MPYETNKYIIGVSANSLFLPISYNTKIKKKTPSTTKMSVQYYIFGKLTDRLIRGSNWLGGGGEGV